ncbi:MAG: serine--tRNA ligase [Candidatus Thermoplasmatota archaeon]
MEFKLKTSFIFSGDISKIENEIKKILDEYKENIEKEGGDIKEVSIEENILEFSFNSEGNFRPHNSLLHLKNILSKKLGKEYHVGVREIKVSKYEIFFELEKKPLKKIDIPFAQLNIDDKKVTMILKEIDEEFLQRNYIDRMIKLVKEKTLDQYYEGKDELWNLIWTSKEKKPVWNKDPTEEMLKKNWLKQGPTKGKWFFNPQSAAIMKAMEKIAINEVLNPLGFQEVIESHIVPFEVWLKTGHMEGMPGEFYYVAEPKTRNVEEWQNFIDLTKIKNEIPLEELKKNTETPNSGICYAQCPIIYWSLQGKTIAEDSLPVLIYDKTAVSNRYESGGRHGIERVDEFHRLEPVYIGTREQLLDIREKLLDSYKHVFNDILDLEWRMAWVTPWYMQQAGIHDDKVSQEKGTIDFEAYMPYRGSREKSEWLEFQNLSIIGDKYVKAFNIKTQKSDLWSGCSGIGLERWVTAFLAQKGLNPEKWPQKFRKYFGEMPQGIKFL